MEVAPDGSKKSPFEDLSRDELLIKCKGLLGIAQKAKLAKSELQVEVHDYKTQLEKYEKEKKDSLENVKILQELVDSLTEQKLNFITELDAAQGKIKSLNNSCDNFQEEILKYKTDLILKDKSIADATQKLYELDTEVTSLKRQNNRLLEENEQLISQLTELEARTAEFNEIGLQQQEQLQILEKRVDTDDEYKGKIEELNAKIEKLQKNLESGADNGKIIEYENKIKELSQSYEHEIGKTEKAYIKLKSYKEKILKCATCINQLKNSRFILSKTVTEYSESIQKWQNEIRKACQMLNDQVNQINDLNNENMSLKNEIEQLKQKLSEELISSKQGVEQQDEKNSALIQENYLYKSQVTSLQEQVEEYMRNADNFKTELLVSTANYVDIKESQLPAQINENKILKHQLNEVNQNCKELSEQNNKLNLLINDLQTKINESNCNIVALETLNLQIRALESEKDILVKEKLNARDNVSELENQNKLLTSEMQKTKMAVDTLKTQLDNITQEKTVLECNLKKEKEREVNNLKCKLMSTQENYDLLKKEFDDLQDLNNLLKEEVETLKFSLEQPKDDTENLSDLNVSLQTDIVKLETKLSAYKQENASLLSEIKETRIKAKEFDTLVAEYEDAKSKLMGYKTENAELLNEMKEINQVLKERGEAISKLQKAIAEMERLIETLEKDRDNVNQEKDDLIKKVEKLETELKNVKQATAKNCEITEQIVLEKDNITKTLNEKDTVIESLKEELERLKQQQPSAELPNEDMSTSTISKAEEHTRMKELDETFEDKYTKLRIFALKLKKKLNETTSQLQNSENDKAKLEKLLSETATIDKVCEDKNIEKANHSQGTEISALQAKIKSLTDSVESSEKIGQELENIKAELATKTQQITAEIEAHRVTKENLEKARRDAKKKNVLSLEMEDYERSMKELTTKMEECKKKMVQMESTIDTQEGTINAMKTQIKLLEEQIKTEEAQIRTVKEEFQLSIEEKKEKDNVIQVKNEIISKLEQDLEDEKRKNEEAIVEMTTLLSDKEKVIVGLGEVKADLNNKLKRVEYKCGELNENLRITNIELADLKTEYSSYKVRAQAVLRQNQTVDHSQEERLKEEAAALQAQIETMNLKLESLQEQCSEQTAEAESSRRRAAEAAGEAARCQQRTARLHADLTRLSQQMDAERTQHKLQVTTLTQCYKSQINDLETKLQKETESLKKQLYAAQEAMKGKLKSSEANDNQYMLPIIPKDENSDGEMDINVSLIPREEGEGSESAPSPPLSKPYTSGASGRSPVPLERLLEEGVPEDEPFDTSSLSLTPDQEIAELRRKLIAQQQRVKHVTVLLSESERECARMSQLSELLKSELRRVRGTSHNAHNTEYMKNVTLKFLTLPPGDERGRLVPVLQKILTLTIDETNKIAAVAKGLDPNPSKGWGSYLPWPGGK